MNTVHVDGDFMHYLCPHCGLWTQVAKADLNCKIFRHGVRIDTGQPINPHASQEEVQSLIQAHGIYGCGGPHQLNQDASGTWMVQACSWSS